MDEPTSVPFHSHDGLVRAIFGVPQHAAAELRAVLPPALLEQLDLDTLTRVEASFVDETLRGSAADLLYRVRLRDGRTLCIYFLIEHQSAHDPGLPLRLLGYLTRIWERHAREREGTARLPPILPIVIHHGPRPWPGPRSFAAALVESVAHPHGSAAAPLDFEFLVDDLAAIDDAELLVRGRDAIAKLTWLALRNSRDHPRFFC